jgi:hypothetical protein
MDKLFKQTEIRKLLFNFLGQIVSRQCAKLEHCLSDIYISEVFGESRQDFPGLFCFLLLPLPREETRVKPGLLKYHCAIDILFDWFGLVCFANKNKNCQLS